MADSSDDLELGELTKKRYRQLRHLMDLVYQLNPNDTRLKRQLRGIQEKIGALKHGSSPKRGAPAGVNDGCHLGHRTRSEMANARRAKIMPIIADLQRAGITNYAAIADELTRLGAPAPRGGRWHKSTIARYLAIVRKEAAIVEDQAAREERRAMCDELRL